MRRAAAAAALCLIAAASAAQEPVCSADPETLACTSEPRADAKGVLEPGFHAWFGAPTNRYDHAILGDAIEWGELTFVKKGVERQTPLAKATVRLPAARVFEDLTPRFADLDGDGTPEIIVVETDIARGASLAVYAFGSGKLVKRAATPFLGRTHRWLAPVGAADLDGDGQIEIAYVETPHLGKTLKIVRLARNRLRLVAEASGLTNHRIGEAFIQGGIAECGGRAVIVTANADWSRVMVSELSDGQLTSRTIGRYRGPESLSAADVCARL